MTLLQTNSSVRRGTQSSPSRKRRARRRIASVSSARGSLPTAYPLPPRMSRPARQAREAGPAQDLFQQHQLAQKQAKHPTRPNDATSTNQRSVPGGGAGSRRLSGPDERTRREPGWADERSAVAVRRAGRRTGHEEQGPAPPPGTHHKYKRCQEHRHASTERKYATIAQLRSTNPTAATTSRPASMNQTNATSVPARARRTNHAYSL